MALTRTLACAHLSLWRSRQPSKQILATRRVWAPSGLAFASASVLHQQETIMANREQRGNREKRKKKADKPKPSHAQTSPFAEIQKGVGGYKPGANQKRK